MVSSASRSLLTRIRLLHTSCFQNTHPIVVAVIITVVLGAVFPFAAAMNRFQKLYLSTMSVSSAFFQPLVAAADAAAVDTKWYPPSQTKVNNLDQVVNGKGIYGWIYDTSNTPSKEYGIYNWCNMPHVRKDIYQKVDDEYELVYVELVSQLKEIICQNRSR